MKKLFIAAIMSLSLLTTSTFAEIKMGIILGFTGPIESLTPAMAASAELAFKEASDSGSLLGGKKITPVRADSTCVDSAAATTAAEGLVAEGVAAIMGADCSGVTGAIASNVAVPNGVVMISPSAPFGGMKDSGYGKEAGIESIKDYTRIKTTWFNTSEKPMADPFTMG